MDWFKRIKDGITTKTDQKKEIAYLLGHKKGVFDIAYSNASNQLILCGGDGSLSFWSLDNFKHQKTLFLESKL